MMIHFTIPHEQTGAQICSADFRGSQKQILILKLYPLHTAVLKAQNQTQVHYMGNKRKSGNPTRQAQL